MVRPTCAGVCGCVGAAQLPLLHCHDIIKTCRKSSVCSPKNLQPKETTPLKHCPVVWIPRLLCVAESTANQWWLTIDGVVSWRHYREMTSPARWASSLAYVEAARTAWTGSGESQTSAAASDERSLRSPSTCGETWENTAFSMSYVVIRSLKAPCAAFIFQSNGPMAMLLELHTSNPTISIKQWSNYLWNYLVP